MTIYNQAPVVIEFSPKSRFCHQDTCFNNEVPHFVEHPHSTVYLADGGTVRLPADQIVVHEQTPRVLRIGLGGMSFEGLENGHLVFWRVRDMFPETELNPQRELKFTLDPKLIKSLHIHGTRVWPAANCCA